MEEDGQKINEDARHIMNLRNGISINEIIRLKGNEERKWITRREETDARKEQDTGSKEGRKKGRKRRE